jgi:hypothetical protein
MNLSIIYIFALFIIFTPHFILKVLHKNKYSFMIYSLLFSVVFYLTYDMVIHKEIEGALLTAYDVHGNEEKVDINNVDLGDVNLNGGFNSIRKPSGLIYTEQTPIGNQPASSLPSLFNRYALEQNINKLFTHDHDDVYKRNKNLNDVLCAADYGKTISCCDQPQVKVPSENVCPKSKPTCKGYVAFEKWGTCENINIEAPPNFEYNEKKVQCFDKNERCKSNKRCCPGGPGSNSDVMCGTEDCPVKGESCVGSWMKDNCPSTCGLCPNNKIWDGDISGYYIAENLIAKNNMNPNHYVMINKLYDNEFTWNNRGGSNWNLKRFSNTESFLISNYPKNKWTMTRVVLDQYNKVISILGPGDELFTKQYYIEKESAPAPKESLGDDIIEDSL